MVCVKGEPAREATARPGPPTACCLPLTNVLAQAVSVALASASHRGSAGLTVTASGRESRSRTKRRPPVRRQRVE
eukprot:10020382-Alexandrium_andersonii.AAC.1